ncbi:hypothetical protein SAMN05216551_102209 [Chitinasiproducens palmae]|uniref:Uncharacterized protein n=1 Tax=Chitinasiproducens palmae TaxID=1770053 RepID=A0A1H2PKP6_9BURK|nr:hypothetical protein SAMN05216551_102209 [Chitinasiproducens palmae]
MRPGANTEPPARPRSDNLIQERATYVSLMSYILRMYSVLTTPQFDKWFVGLRDPIGSAAISLRI